MAAYRVPAPRTVEEWATGAPPSLPPRRERPLWLRITLLALFGVGALFLIYAIIVGTLIVYVLVIIGWLMFMGGAGALAASRHL